jgi:hypothetical protein
MRKTSTVIAGVEFAALHRFACPTDPRTAYTSTATIALYPRCKRCRIRVKMKITLRDGSASSAGS